MIQINDISLNKMMHFSDISFGRFVSMIFAAFWIFIFFLIVIKYIIPRIKKERLQDRLQFYMPLIRNLVWVLYAIDLIYELALINPYVTLGLLGVGLALSWQLVRDYIQGIIFGFQKGNIIGQRIKIGEYSGIISELNATKLNLEIENGEIIQFPYNAVTSQVISKPTFAKHLKSCGFTVSISNKVDVDKAKQKLMRYLLNMPWVISSMNIKIEVIEKENQQIDLKVVVYTSDEKYVPKIKQAVGDLIF